MISYPVVSVTRDRRTRRSAGEDELGDDSEQVHVSKRLAPVLYRSFGAKDPQDQCDNNRKGEMQQTIWQPREDIENGIGVSRLQVADVCTVQDTLQRRQKGDVDGRSMARWDISRAEKRQHPCEDRRSWPNKLRCDR